MPKTVIPHDDGSGWSEFTQLPNQTLRFYSLINSNREIEVEAKANEIIIKHHGKVIMFLCKAEARKLSKALEYAALEASE